MNNKLVIPLIILALIGLYFIGSNITGYVISQSCCYPPDCEPENMCDFTEQHQKYSASLDIANHTVYINRPKKKVSTVPRHSEINEYTARKICKDLDIPAPQ